MRKHTPGPWCVVETMALDYRPCQVYGADGGSLVATCEGGGRQRAIDKAEERSNARLIAAAPNMLAALMAIRGGLADTGSTPSQRMTLITKSTAYMIADVAIAEATEGRHAGTRETMQPLPGLGGAEQDQPAEPLPVSALPAQPSGDTK